MKSKTEVPCPDGPGKRTRIKHGAAMPSNKGTPLARVYGVWHCMKDRCLNPKHEAFDRYHGRGITICERWMQFANFWADMGDSYKEGLTLERKDNAKGYNPDNCTWATYSEQNRNRRSNRILTLNGESMSIVQWSEKIGIDQRTIHSRIWRGWSEERALTEPMKWGAHNGRWRAFKEAHGIS